MAGSERPSYDELAALVVAQAAVIATIEPLRAELARMTERVAELERQLGTNSRNSSKPPSQDVYVKPAPKSLRGKTGRGKGKQPGAAGANLKLVDNPDRVVEHVPSACSGCGTGLRNRPSVDVGACHANCVGRGCTKIDRPGGRSEGTPSDAEHIASSQ
ncbi:DUF6444 domain-containing protein [Amycolatopsis sp. cg5]|uniref:DUF6444 domain-containing protein n=1 Tax=Amycolatopsis sp. cg5 TaxID=3238802 RepID=UPI00352589F0